MYLKKVHKHNFAFMAFRGEVLNKFSYLKRFGHICVKLQNKLSNSILKPQKLSITYCRFVVCFDCSVQDLEIGKIWLSNWYERYTYSNKHNMNIRKWATIICQVLQYVGLNLIQTICNWMKALYCYLVQSSIHEIIASIWSWSIFHGSVTICLPSH